MRVHAMPRTAAVLRGAARGFWITRWYQDATMHAIRGMMADLIPLAAAGKLQVPVETTYPLSAYADAIAHATQDSRSGKILFHH